MENQIRLLADFETVVVDLATSCHNCEEIGIETIDNAAVKQIVSEHCFEWFRDGVGLDCAGRSLAPG